MTNWIKTNIGSVVRVLSGSTPSTKEPAYWDGEISWITPKDLSGYKSVFIEDGEKSITKTGLKNSSASLLPKNTILFSSRAPIGYVAIANKELTTNQGFKNIVCDEKHTHYRFMYYWFKYNTNMIERLSSGSTFSEASASLVRSLEINLPPLPEQKSIAKVLSSLDDKIELLRAQNETLEKTAQAVFKEWFVNFNFPDKDGKPYKDNGGKMVDSELGEIPEGWRVGRLGEEFNLIVSDFVANGSFASLKENVTILENKEYALFVRNTDLKSGFTEKRYVDKKSYDFLKKTKLYGGEIIISNVGDVGSVYLCPKIEMPMTLGNNVIMIKSDYQKYLYSLFISHNGKYLLGTITAGSAQQKFNKTDFKNLEMIIPSKEFLKMFEDLLDGLYEKIDTNNNQIQTLTKTRDRLLPKLMSGEIRIN